MVYNMYNIVMRRALPTNAVAADQTTEHYHGNRSRIASVCAQVPDVRTRARTLDTMSVRRSTPVHLYTCVVVRVCEAISRQFTHMYTQHSRCFVTTLLYADRGDEKGRYQHRI